MNMMNSSAVLAGVKATAKTMSDSDLKWQIANAKKLRIPASLNQVFKAELRSRDAKQGSDEVAHYGRNV
jgi:hypothetical protein